MAKAACSPTRTSAHSSFPLRARTHERIRTKGCARIRARTHKHTHIRDTHTHTYVTHRHTQRHTRTRPHPRTNTPGNHAALPDSRRQRPRNGSSLSRRRAPPRGGGQAPLCRSLTAAAASRPSRPSASARDRPAGGWSPCGAPVLYQVCGPAPLPAGGRTGIRIARAGRTCLTRMGGKGRGVGVEGPTVLPTACSPGRPHRASESTWMGRHGGSPELRLSMS